MIVKISEDLDISLVESDYGAETGIALRQRTLRGGKVDEKRVAIRLSSRGFYPGLIETALDQLFQRLLHRPAIDVLGERWMSALTAWITDPRRVLLVSQPVGDGTYVPMVYEGESVVPPSVPRTDGVPAVPDVDRGSGVDFALSQPKSDWSVGGKTKW